MATDELALRAHLARDALRSHLAEGAAEARDGNFVADFKIADVIDQLDQQTNPRTTIKIRRPPGP